MAGRSRSGGRNQYFGYIVVQVKAGFTAVVIDIGREYLRDLEERGVVRIAIHQNIQRIGVVDFDVGRRSRSIPGRTCYDGCRSVIRFRFNVLGAGRNQSCHCEE